MEETTKLLLDVGCGCQGVGDVNLDVFKEGFNIQIGKGEIVNPHTIKNFVLASACFLPFKTKSFDVAFSSHVIEHVEFPFLMVSEMCRVASKQVIIRCPHRRGSGAKRPFHINYFDEQWFRNFAVIWHYRSREKITIYDWNISSRIPFPEYLRTSLVWRVFKHIERLILNPKRGIPSELESCIDTRKQI
jgi:ubiquinone/menaquinone biosynthesis C-methylase UbiE